MSRFFMFAIIGIVIVATTAVSVAQQQTPRPTADQIVQQILENDARNLRDSVGKLAEKVNMLTDQVTALTKERDELKQKCGDLCK